jgi:hypothetical protein
MKFVLLRIKFLAKPTFVSLFALTAFGLLILNPFRVFKISECKFERNISPSFARLAQFSATSDQQELGRD